MCIFVCILEIYLGKTVSIAASCFVWLVAKGRLIKYQTGLLANQTNVWCSQNCRYLILFKLDESL